MVERGAKVFLTRKNFKKLNGTVETLNSIKPIYTREKVNPVKDNFKAIRSADIIIGATNGKPVISKRMLLQLSRMKIPHWLQTISNNHMCLAPSSRSEQQQQRLVQTNDK